MGHNRSAARNFIIPSWSYTVAELLAHQVESGAPTAWRSCTTCGDWLEVPLARLVIQKGPLFSLWGRRPPCPKCRKPMLFHGHHAPGSRVIPFILDNPTDHQIAELHRAWERERRRRLGYDRT